LTESSKTAAEAGLLPWEFWNMTPAELTERHEARCERDDREWERSAWMVSWILAAWTKDPPTVDELLGRTVEM
jgi:hypothetical protein